MARLLSTAQMPARAPVEIGSEDQGSSEPGSRAPAEVDHDHAWRRNPAQRGEAFAEYRCDLCDLSYLE